jgi:hypothetical protein
VEIGTVLSRTNRKRKLARNWVIYIALEGSFKASKEGKQM